jgi:hypothetical protein
MKLKIFRACAHKGLVNICAIWACWYSPFMSWVVGTYNFFYSSFQLIRYFVRQMSHLVDKCNIRTLWRLLVPLYLTIIRRSSATLHSWQLEEWVCDSHCWWLSFLGYAALLIANLLLALGRRLMPSSSSSWRRIILPEIYFPSPTLKMDTVGFWNAVSY